MSTKKLNKTEWNKKYPKGKPDLAFTSADYELWGREVPSRLKKNQESTEGLMMSAEEIEQWFSDNIMTLKILKESNEDAYMKLYDSFKKDAEYLFRISRIREELLEHINDEKSLDF